jgi:hypothetical protein
MMRAVCRLLLAALVSAAIAGCAEVKPWDRDLLAEKQMALVPAPLDSSLDAHIFFSKEASSGGVGVGGGGCGCN